MKNKYSELRLRSFSGDLLDYVDELVRVKNIGRKHSLYSRKDIIEAIIEEDIRRKSDSYTNVAKEEIKKVYKIMAEKLDSLQTRLDDVLEQNTVLIAIELKERGLLSEPKEY